MTALDARNTRVSRPQLQVVTSMHINSVLADSGHIDKSFTPVFTSLNTLEIAFLAGLADGKSLVDMAQELSRSQKYLEQVMLKIRRKVSGVSQFDKPTINRNQLMYHAGLASLVENAVSLQSKTIPK
ncbi:MAG: hypothetical protein ACI9UN_001316 [Granulosicoccus sp.]|jgi:hypothetical protein